MYDILSKKRDGAPLSDGEIRFAVDGFTRGLIPDYQMAALLMAAYINGLDARELASLTAAMTDSGDTVDLSVFGDRTVDKHSTGGVGDKTTLIVAPIVSALGGKVAKMSGRGLGHTGGTVDKLESIPGYKTTLSREAFVAQVSEIGIAVVGQSGEIAPADKKIYALRDVTATVDSLPLIASSIMSKKLSSGAHSIVLDVKTGSGAFMKTVSDATRLAETMVGIGRRAGRRMSALITDMDIPLGRAIGNALEVTEAVEVLSGGGPEDLARVSMELSARMACLCLGWPYDKSMEEVGRALENGAALEKFRQWIAFQGGDTGFLDGGAPLPAGAAQHPYKALQGGFITGMDAERIGKAASALGAGRARSDDAIDHGAGIVLLRKTGEFCEKGEPVAILHTGSEALLPDARAYMDAALTFGRDRPAAHPHIHAVIE